MGKVIIAYNKKQDRARWEAFKKAIAGGLSKVETDFFSTTEDEVSFVSSASNLEAEDVKDATLVIAAEEVDGLKIGAGRIRQWKNANENLMIILIVDKEKKGSSKLNALFEMGYYDAVLSSDFSMKTLESLIIHGRGKDEAYNYYGLMLYTDYSRINKETRKRVQKEAELQATEKVAEEDSFDNTSDKVTAKVNFVIEQKKLKETKKKTVSDDVKKLPEKTSKNPTKKSEKGGKNKKETKTSEKREEVNKSIEQKDEKSRKKTIKPEELVERAQEKAVFSQRNENSAEVEPERDSMEGEEDFFDPYADYGEQEEETLIDELPYEPIDTSEYLAPLMLEERMKEKDWLKSKDDKEARRFIKNMEKVAFNPTRIIVNLSPVDEVLEDILRYFTTDKEGLVWMAGLENGTKTKDNFLHTLKMRVDMYTELSLEEKKYVFDNFCNFMWDYDILTPFIEDPTISDIALVDYNNIQIKKRGKRYLSKITFRTPNHFNSFITHIVRLNHVDLSDKNPDKTFMDTRTSAAARMRFVYSQEYINAKGEPSLVIRKVPTTKYTIEQLVDLGMMDYNTAAYLVTKVREGASIVFTGTMASGKTTLMNTLLDFIRHDKRGLVIQENDELFSNTHPLLQFQVIRPSEDGSMKFDLRYLATYGLLMDLEYFVISEIKGKECEQFIEAAYTNTIPWTSVHSPSAEDGLPRLASLGVTEHFGEKEQLRKLATGIDLVVYLEKFCIEEISEVKGWDTVNQKVLYKKIPINVPRKTA